MLLVGWVGKQSKVYRVYSRGLRTQPWGEPVLRVNVEEWWGPSLPVCGRFDRKCLIQVQVLLYNISGMIVLNAEL